LRVAANWRTVVRVIARRSIGDGKIINRARLKDRTHTRTAVAEHQAVNDLRFSDAELYFLNFPFGFSRKSG
jgi:hypothetical protein